MNIKGKGILGGQRVLNMSKSMSAQVGDQTGTFSAANLSPQGP